MSDSSLAQLPPAVHVALWEPEIPPNTGNIARLCAATLCPLHLIGRLGFRLDDRSLRRAGVDCWSDVAITRHATWEAFTGSADTRRLVLFSARGDRIYTDFRFEPNDCLVFG